MKKYLMLSMLICSISWNFVQAQTSKFHGIWELMRPPFSPDNKSVVFPLLRVFDEKGIYTQIAITNIGSFTEMRASFTPVTNELVEEHILFSSDRSRIDQTLKFNYKFFTVGTSQYFMTEGAKKIVDGKEVSGWREVWKKVEEFGAN